MRGLRAAEALRVTIFALHHAQIEIVVLQAVCLCRFAEALQSRRVVFVL